MLHPWPEIRTRNIDELEGGASGVEALVFEQLSTSSWPVKRCYNGLSVFNHVAVQLHQLAFFSRAHEQKGHPCSMRVPYFAPTSISLILELTNGHIGNHCRNTHVRTGSFVALYAFMPTAVSEAFVQCRLAQQATWCRLPLHVRCCENTLRIPQSLDCSSPRSQPPQPFRL